MKKALIVVASLFAANALADGDHCFKAAYNQGYGKKTLAEAAQLCKGRIGDACFDAAYNQGYGKKTLDEAAQLCRGGVGDACFLAAYNQGYGKSLAVSAELCRGM